MTGVRNTLSRLVAVVRGAQGEPPRRRHRTEAARCGVRVPVGLAAGLLVGAIGCVKAPDSVYLVDKRTVLEKQASGEFSAMENTLEAAAVKPDGELFTVADLEASGYDVNAVKSVAAVYEAFRSDEERLDSLLVRRCVGEATSGLLLETPSSCTGAVNADELNRLVQRTNRNRRQLWVYILRQRPGQDEDTVRGTWREAHLESVVCGGQIQRPDGSWEVKKCD